MRQVGMARPVHQPGRLHPGLHALHEVAGRRRIDEAVAMPGRMTHALDGKLALLPYGLSEREHINSMSRSG